MTADDVRVIVCKDCEVSALRLPADVKPGTYYWSETRCPPCLAKIGRIVSAPILTRARVNPDTYSKSDESNHKDTGTPVSTPGISFDSIQNGHYINGVLPGLEDIDTQNSLSLTHERIGESEGEGSILSRRRDIPEELRGFDAILRMHHTTAPTKHHVRRYKPSPEFYDRIFRKWKAVPGQYDLDDAARDMIDWLAVHRDRTLDIARFAERWLETEANRRSKWSRNGRGPYQKDDAERYRMGGGLSTTETDAVDAMTERGRSHYER